MKCVLCDCITDKKWADPTDGSRGLSSRGKQTKPKQTKGSEFSLEGMNLPSMGKSLLFTERIFLVGWQLSGENGRNFIVKM